MAGEKSLAELEAKHGALPATRTIITSPGHLQLWYAQPPGVKTKSSAGASGPGLDVRGDGGYVIAPPSVHPDTKKPYFLSRNGKPVEAPAWNIELTREDHKEPTAPTDGKSGAAAAPIPEGSRDATLTSLAGSMRRRGMSFEAIEAALNAENRRRCSPPMPDREVTKIARSVARYEPTASLLTQSRSDSGNAE